MSTFIHTRTHTHTYKHTHTHTHTHAYTHEAYCSFVTAASQAHGLNSFAINLNGLTIYHHCSVNLVIPYLSIPLYRAAINLKCKR